MSTHEPISDILDIDSDVPDAAFLRDVLRSLLILTLATGAVLFTLLNLQQPELIGGAESPVKEMGSQEAPV